MGCVKYTGIALLVILTILGVALFTRPGKLATGNLTAWHSTHLLERGSSKSDVLLTALGLVLDVSSLLTGGSDFRRELMLTLLSVSGGYRNGSVGVLSAFGDINLMPFTYHDVAEDIMNPAQKRMGGPFCGNPCVPQHLTLCWSNGDKHSLVRRLLREHVPGLDTAKKPFKLHIPSWITGTDANNVTAALAHNVFRQMWETDLKESHMTHLMDWLGGGQLCAVGYKILPLAVDPETANKNLRVFVELIGASRPGKALLEAAKAAGLSDEEVLPQAAFGTLFAGIGGTSHLATHALQRIREDMGKMRPLWAHDPSAFLREHARLDPPVTSYNSVFRNVTVEIKGKSVRVPPNTMQQGAIVAANRDPAVFGENAQEFVPSRMDLDRTLTWNGEDREVLARNAPRGCPGRHLSEAVAKAIVEHYLTLDAAQEGRQEEL